MGYNNEASSRSALVFDLEAAPIDGAADYLEPVEAPANYKKPEAIASYCEAEQAKQLGKCALDPDLARIVALAWQYEGEAPMICLCPDEDTERKALQAFWTAILPYPYPRLVGFNVLHYDLPVMLRRSLYLDVKTPPLEIGKYRHPSVDDLALMLSFNGDQRMRSLAFYAKRMGLPRQDTIPGADVPQAVAEGRWSDIEAHIRADIETTAALAARLGCFNFAVAGVF